MVERHVDVRLQPTRNVSDIVPIAEEFDPTDRIQLPDGIGQLKFAADANLGLGEPVEDLPREHVSSRDREVRRRLIARWFLNEIVDREARSVGVPIEVRYAVLRNLRLGNPFERQNGRPVALCLLDERRGTGRPVRDNRIAEQQRERFVTDVLAGVLHRVAEPVSFLLAGVVDIREIGNLLNAVQSISLSVRFEFLFEFVRLVEVAFNRLLSPAGDDKNVVDPCVVALS